MKALITLLAIIPTLALAQRPSPLRKYQPTTLQSIGAEYEAKILPIFKKACFDCHSQETRYPWFYELPRVKEFIDVRILEAREDVLMTRSFPFTNRHDPIRVLATIKHVVSEDIMPRWEYQLLFWEAILSDEEKARILAWTDKGIASLAKDLNAK